MILISWFLLLLLLHGRFLTIDIIAKPTVIIIIQPTPLFALRWHLLLLLAHHHTIWHFLFLLLPAEIIIVVLLLL
jgi:hypothetical protein